MQCNSNCQRCVLHQTTERVCAEMFPIHKNGHKRCIVAILNSPDRQTEHFLRAVYFATAEEREDDQSLADRVDVYCTYAVRCQVPPKTTITIGMQSACRPYLVREINELLETYEEVVLLCCGGAASKTVSDLAQKQGVKHQGDPVESLKPMPKRDEWQDVALCRPCRVFHTFSPKVLAPGVDPSAIDYIKRHLTFVTSYLDDKVSLEAASVPLPQMGLVVDADVMTVDIETYGFSATLPEQRHFHPRKSVTWDGIRPTDAIISISISTDDTDVAYDWTSVSHRRAFLQSLQNLSKRNGLLQGFNLPFDIVCMRHFFPICRKWLDYPLRLKDCMSVNSRYREDRPEMDLKTLTDLYNLLRYEKDSNRRYLQSDPDLYRYNAQDTRNSHDLIPLIEAEIAQEFPHSEKLTDRAHDWFSDLLWGLIWMMEAGSSIDVGAMTMLDASLARQMETLMTDYEEEFGVPLAGPGSRQPTVELFVSCVNELGIADHRDVQYTKTGLSTGKQNINLILDRSADLQPSHGKAIRMLAAYRKAMKVRTSYTDPMLRGVGKQEARRHIKGVVYPQWYPYRSQFEDQSEGGTIQVRPTCKNPALPTAPPVVQACYSTRYDPGFRAHADYGQLEWRIAALLSRDEVMTKEITEGLDAHQATAVAMFGDAIVNHPDFKSKYRQAGKMTNFGTLFGAKAYTLQMQLRRQFGIEVELDVCQKFIDAVYGRYEGLARWQRDELVPEVLDLKYLEIPILGYSRRFKGSAGAIMATYSNEIVNLRVQGCASAVNMSARFELQKELRGQRAHVVLDVYDAIDIEGQLDMLCHIRHRALHHMHNSPYLLELQDRVGWEVPMDVDFEVACTVQPIRVALDEATSEMYDISVGSGQLATC